MNPDDITQSRLINQQIAGTNIQEIKDLVSRMGAMQAQDFNMAKWAVGVRMPQFTEKSVEEAFNRGEILRTHLLRPTWHFVSADDICWILELTAPHIKSSMKSRRNELGITSELIFKSNKVIESRLSTGEHIARDEIVAALKQNSITMNDPQAYYHLILYAELDGIICSGRLNGKEHTYALLANRIPAGKNPGAPKNRDEALAELSKRYFFSHGPATLLDFAWWSGLSITDAKKSVNMLKPDIIQEKIGTSEYMYYAPVKPFSPKKQSIYLLPAYDEFIISYKDRSASLPKEQNTKAISSNGIFRPVIVINGKVAGIWKRIAQKNDIRIEPEFFQPPDENDQKLLDNATRKYSAFLEEKNK
jgi:hypothetical protein